MPFTREQAFAGLASLNPAPVFLDSYRNRHLVENVEIYFGPPEEFFIAPETQALYTRDRLVPILDDENFSNSRQASPRRRDVGDLGRARLLRSHEAPCVSWVHGSAGASPSRKIIGSWRRFNDERVG
jgi:hypothetical protein